MRGHISVHVYDRACLHAFLYVIVHAFVCCVVISGIRGVISVWQGGGGGDHYEVN